MTDGRGTAQGWGGPAGEPDWAAMAERHQREVRRRKQIRVVGGVVAATLVVGGITATAVGLAGSGTKGGTPAASGGSTSATGGPAAAEPVEAGTSAAPSTSATQPASPSASGSTSARPSASPTTARPSAGPGSSAPADPLTVISSAATDTAPLDPAALFPATATVGGRTWTRLATATTDPCWKATTGGLGDVLAAHGCRSILRATYTSGSGAVTVGIAVLDTKAQADAVAAAHKGQVQGLVPAGNTSYCVSPGCANTHATVGRYGYYTVAGTVKPGGTAQDAAATAAQADFAARARSALLARGRR
ncbi:hypothetical protein [Kitasatospora sp. NPDC085879]|uniref:hypothetical protein n=1 Tax=Kitasatospora sp. NPDC085879 TaxID=3154769 RepID=UPI0034191CA1